MSPEIFSLDAVEEFVEQYTNVDDSGKKASLSNNVMKQKLNLFMNALKVRNKGNRSWI